MLHAHLAPDEEDARDEAEHEADGQGRVEQAVGDLLDRVDDGHDREDRQHRRREVDAGLAVPVGLAQHRDAHCQDQHHDRQVDEEDAGPPEVLDEEAAQQRAQRRAPRGADRPDRDGPRALARVVEGIAHDRQGRGHDRGAEDAHEETAQDEDLRSGGERADQGGGGETRRPDQEHPFAPVAVRDIADGDQQPRDGEGVDVADPQDLVRSGVQIGAQRGHRQGEDGVVDRQQQDGHREHAEYAPLAPCERLRRGLNRHSGLPSKGCVAVRV